MKSSVIVAAALLGGLTTAAHAKAKITIVNEDAAGEGFNDRTAASPVGGNQGKTVGDQRLRMFQFAADRWGEILDSSVEIVIRATFDPLECDATAATLGSAGAFGIFANFPGAPLTGVWFSGALADKLAGQDLDPGNPDIVARFNSRLNGDLTCLNGATWYYGFDNKKGANQSDLLPVLLHEFGHGLGFQSFVNSDDGTLLEGLPDQYLRWMFDNMVGKSWTTMTDPERAVSARNARRVVWTGTGLAAEAATYLTPGTPGLQIVAPAALAGNYLIGDAEFGAPLGNATLSGDLRYVVDSAGNFTGCAPYAAGTFTNRIALIDRGVCGFVVKVKNAQAAGAIAVVVADSEIRNPPPGLGGQDVAITITSVLITQTAGNALKAALTAGQTASIKLLRDPAVLAGADASNRVMLYTPDPVIGGSSISHFDTSTSPNTLMEPNITDDLTSEVDLTLPLFRDLGWYPDADVDRVPDDVDICVDDADPDQVDSDGDGVGDACEGGGGCCSTHKGSPQAALALSLLIGLVLARRRRS
jgi:PA domain